MEPLNKSFQSLEFGCIIKKLNIGAGGVPQCWNAYLGSRGLKFDPSATGELLEEKKKGKISWIEDIGVEENSVV